MKTSFIASACLLALVLTLVAQSPPPAQNPPGAPATSPAAQAPTNPAAVNPAAPMQSPATNVPQGQQPAVPGTSVPVTLSPAPGAVTSPAAGTAISPSPAASPTPEQPTGFLAGNWLIDKFHKGGPVMWPILIVSIIALTVVIERCCWWGGRWFPRDPVLRMMWNGLNHQHASLQGALQVAAGIEIKRAGRFLVVMDTLVTLAPLLGLLGTITGLIRSFSFLGNEELAVQAVTGGIAEALIATACGLGIAIFALIPFNFFTSRVSNLEFELQTAATSLEVMLEAQNKTSEVQIPGTTPTSATRSSI